MTDTFKKLAGQQLLNSESIIYTCPSSTQTIIRRIKVVSNGLGATFQLWHGAATDANLITPMSASIGSNGFAEDDDVICMSAAEVIRGQASFPSALTITLYGDEIS